LRRKEVESAAEAGLCYMHKVPVRYELMLKHQKGELVSWSLTSLFSTNMAISETNQKGDVGKQSIL